MVIQYPNTGKAYLPGNSVRDGVNWSGSSLSLAFQTRCRAELARNVGNAYIIGQDAKQITFSCIVYMPLPNIISVLIGPDEFTGTEQVYAGETIVYVVPADLHGQDEVTLSDLSGQKFALVVDGRPLIKDTEFQIQASGFKLIGSTLITGQRFEITKYYTFKTSVLGDTGVSSGSDFNIKPGTLFEVWDGERLIVKENVKQFSKGQLNARVWL